MSLQGTFQGVPRDLMILIISWVLRVLRWSEQPGWVFPCLQPQGEEGQWENWGWLSQACSTDGWDS